MFKAIYNFFHKHYHTHYHGRYLNAKKLFVFDLGLMALSLITLAAGLFFFFWKPGLTNWIDLNFSYGNNRIKSGEKVQLTIDYTNRSKTTLTDVVLAVHLPAGFVIDRNLTPTSSFTEQSVFYLPNIPPGGKGEKIIHGWLWTEPQKETELIAVLSYTTENIKRREQKFGSFLINLPESIIKTKLNLNNNKTYSANRLPLEFILTNTENYPLENISLNYTWADKISWQEETEKLNFSPKEEKIFHGELIAPQKTGIYTLTIQPEIVVNNKTIKLNRITKDITVIAPEVTVKAALNANIAYTEPNGSAPIKITWKNNSPYELKNLKIKINTTPGIVNLKETAKQNNLKILGNSLVMDASNRTLLADGKPQATGETEINLILLPSFSLNEQERVSLEITPVLEAELNEITGQSFSYTGAPMKILLATNATMHVEARYFTAEGDQLGRGPLPPRVGQTTKYWLFIQLQNTTNRLKDISLTANLAPGIQFTGRQNVTIGQPLKIQGEKINWDIDQLPANSISGWYLEVAVTPTETQVGKNIILMKDINIMATDAETGKQFNLKQNNISNILSENDIGKRQGSAVEY